MADVTEPLAAPRHLLVRLPNPLGDAVLATPALRGLRRALGTARITWAGGPGALALLDGLEASRDGVVPVAGPMARGLLAPFRAGRMWRRLDPDAVLLLPNSWSSGLAARVSRAPVRVGSRLGGRRILLTHPVSLPMENGELKPRSMARMYLDLAAPFGAIDDGEGPRLAATPYDERRALARLAGTPSAPILGVNPGAAFGSSKCYPPEKLGAAVAAVRDETGVLPLILCGPGEEDLAARTARAAGEPVISTASAPPDLGELKGLLRRTALLLTTDAGPRHVAEALGVPTVVLMGPTQRGWTEDSPARVVRNEDLPCLGCHNQACPTDHRCMTELAPERVAAAALEELQRRPPARPPGS